MIESLRLLVEAIRLGMEKRPHVCLCETGDSVDHRLLTATGAGAVTGNKRLVVAPHHQVVLEMGNL